MERANARSAEGGGEPKVNGGPGGERLKRFLNTFVPLLALIVVFGFFAILNPRMLSPSVLEIIVQQSVIIGIAAIGMTLVIIAGGIDLSVGSMIAMASVVAALVMDAFGFGPGPAILAGAGIGLALGLCNGVLITKLNVVPFIVTLGMLLVVRGLAQGLAGSMPVNVEPSWLNGLLASLPAERRWMLFPPGAWLMFAAALLVGLFLRHTPLGRHIFAVGSNESTARLCGVAVQKVKLFVYSAAGLFAGISGIMLLSYQEQGDPTGAFGYELDVIAAVVIGGGSLRGGQGSIAGSLIGAIIMTVIRTGCQLMGWPAWVTQTVTGAVIVVAVAIDQIRHRQNAV